MQQAPLNSSILLLRATLDPKGFFNMGVEP